MTDPCPLGQAAEEYARMGWAVFPVKPRDKTPLTRRGLKDASSRADMVRGWWTRWPDANIGLNCGMSEIVAIDLDKHGERDGLHDWAELTSKHHLQIKTSTSLTGGGGRHLLFKVPPDLSIKNSVGIVAPGIDIRGDGGYIVLPPSVHPSGKPYTWEGENTNIAPLPEEIIDILNHEPDPWQIFTLKDAFAPREPVAWVVEKVISAGSLTIWYGAPGTLKSMLLADLAISVASGQHWLSEPGKPATGLATLPGAVMWLDFDNGQRRTHERFAALARTRKLSDATPLYYVSMPTPTLLVADDESIRSLAARVLDLNISLLVIDNLGTITGDVEENSADMQKPMTNLRWLAETGVAVSVIHHQRKSNGETKNARTGEALRGHGSIEASLDLAMVIGRNGQDVTATPTKTRGAEVLPINATFSFQNDEANELLEARFWPTNAEAEKQEEQKNLRQLIIEEVRTNGAMSANAIHEALGGNRNHLLDVLRQMNLEKQLAKKPNPRGGFLLILP